MYERIRALREDRDLTQREMGQLLACSQRIYSNYERGDVDIPTAVLIRLADFYDVSVDYLLNRTDNKQIAPSRRRAAQRPLTGKSARCILQRALFISFLFFTFSHRQSAAVLL